MRASGPLLQVMPGRFLPTRAWHLREAAAIVGGMHNPRSSGPVSDDEFRRGEPPGRLRGDNSWRPMHLWERQDDLERC